MCEVFSIIGTAIAGAVGATVSAGAATAIGVGTTIVGGAALGAGAGMASAAITGGNIGKGALWGAIGGGLLAPIGVAAGSAFGAAGGAIAGVKVGATAGAIGGGVIGSTIGGLTAGAISGIRSTKKQVAVGNAIAAKTKNTLSSSVETTQQVEKTATTLKDKILQKRTLASLRIPLKQSDDSSNIGLNTSNGGGSGATGLNIPM